MIKTEEEIEAMRAGGRVLREILKALEKETKPGVTTEELEKMAERMIIDSGSQSSFKGYKVSGCPPFPGVLCTSINDEVVHGVSVPSRELKDGDIVGLDCGLIYGSGNLRVYLDSAITVPVGGISKEARNLISVTRDSLHEGIKTIRDGITTGDLGFAIQSYVESFGFGVVRELVGHGVGRAVHEPPQVPNYGSPKEGDILRAGMTIAVEPMVTLGDWRLNFHKKSWKVVTSDGSLSAHFEHTVLVTEDGYEILT